MYCDWTDLIVDHYDSGTFTFKVMASYNRNTRQCDSDFAESPGREFDFKVYTIKVTDGSAVDDAGNKLTFAGTDSNITIKADAAPKGKQFNKWTVVSGDVTFADSSSPVTTFQMPAGAVEVAATYVDLDHVHRGTLVPAVSATCKKEGSKAYYVCDCEKYFEDAACTKEITQDIEEWKVIAKTGHTFGGDQTCDICGYEKPADPSDSEKPDEDKENPDNPDDTDKDHVDKVDSLKVKLSAKSYIYNGKTRKPTVNVTDSNGRKVAASNYKVKYAKGCKNVGTYKVTVTFKGKYSGKKTLTFKINPKKTKVKSVKAVKRGFTVKWSKVSTKMRTKRITGYQVQYSASRKFTRPKTKKVEGYKKTDTKITGLKAKKNYYVRVRTHMKVSGKNYYSDWTEARKIKTKK